LKDGNKTVLKNKYNVIKIILKNYVTNYFKKLFNYFE